MVVEERNEVGDGALEVNVVFPERVVGVDEQGLAGRELGHGIHGNEVDGVD
jgi:hypothetical protein